VTSIRRLGQSTPGLDYAVDEGNLGTDIGARLIIMGRHARTVGPVTGIFHPAAVIKPDRDQAPRVFALQYLGGLAPGDVNGVSAHSAADLAVTDKGLLIGGQGSKSSRSFPLAGFNGTAGTARHQHGGKEKKQSTFHNEQTLAALWHSVLNKSGVTNDLLEHGDVAKVRA
jgi:hypothetical protein